MANLITLARIALLFATVGLIYLREPWAAFTAAVLTIIVFVSDALDGYVARKRGRADAAGAVFDIAGDRVVENVYWVVCAHLGLITVWAPLVMLVRSFAVDAVRSLALAEGKTAFGKETMMQSQFGLWLSASRLHRGLYGAAKVVAFVYLIGQYGLLLWAEQDPARFAGWGDRWPLILGIGQGLALFAVAYGLLRGAVVLWDARRYFIKPPAP
ncbi:MAG: CDP-alcohol phosphatidyltransferase family protein [Chloroflexota bacterium]|nr:CDP-alcohol phosphatidyltransferase family protein [Chloroflexota bacterium]